MDAGHLASAVLMASGAAGIAIPGRAAQALELGPGTAALLTAGRRGR
ncbi:MAG: hypothetical protein ACJ72E_08355 [Marmoricola sp.]